jgi:predicted dehydrogenase/uncharacterized protein (DUF362 family)
VAAADVNETRLKEIAEKFGVNDQYNDYKLMLTEADIDAVFVCSPPQYHFPIVTDALKSGKHVFCEKPLATTPDEASALKDTLETQQKTSGIRLFLMPAHNFIFTSCFSEALKQIQNDEIGKIQKIIGHATTNLQFYGAKTDFRTQAKCGVIEDLLPHLIYLVHKVGGPLEKVSCIEPYLKGGFVGDVDVNLTLTSGAQVELRAQWTGLVPTLSLKLIGETGTIKLDVLRTPNNITVVKNGEAKTTHMGRRIRQYIDVMRFKHPSYANEHKHFLSVIEHQAEPQVTVDDGIELVKTLAATTECFEGNTCATQLEAETVAVLKVGDNVADAVKKSVQMVQGFRGVKKDDLVVIKPNVCFPKNPQNMIVTDRRVLESVIDLAKNKTKNVVVVESDARSGTAERRMIETGVMDTVKQCDAEFLNLSKDEVEEHKIGDLPIQIPKTALKADYFVNLPKVKTNMDTVVTIAMKNMFGIIATRQKTQFHKQLADTLVYLSKTIPQDLIVVDGITAMEGLGPIRGSPVSLGLIISGKNPVTVDAACTHIIGFNPYAVEALWKAHQQGMGEIDPQKIKFIGEPLENVKTKLSLPLMSKRNLIEALRTEYRLRFHK